MVIGWHGSMLSFEGLKKDVLLKLSWLFHRFAFQDTLSVVNIYLLLQRCNG